MSNAPRRTAAKKTAAKKATPASRRTDSPAAVGFNFDTWSRPDADSIEPFPIVIGGKRYESEDPLNIDFRDIQAGMQDPMLMFQSLFPDDHEEILANPVPMGAVIEFNTAAEAHFGLKDFTAAQS